MTRRNHYNTKQMSELIHYLQSVQGRHVTVNDIYEYFAESGIPIGTTTIYRRLDKLIDDGLVAKYTIDGVSGSCFEYLGENACHKDICIHCKCEVCGAIVHLHCDELKLVGKHLSEKHGFWPDANRTVIYGVCSDCRE